MARDERLEGLFVTGTQERNGATVVKALIIHLLRTLTDDH